MNNEAPKKQITFWIDANDAEAMEKAAKDAGVSVAGFLRLLIKQWTDGIVFGRKPEK